MIVSNFYEMLFRHKFHCAFFAYKFRLYIAFPTSSKYLIKCSMKKHRKKDHLRCTCKCSRLTCSHSPCHNMDYMHLSCVPSAHITWLFVVVHSEWWKTMERFKFILLDQFHSNFFFVRRDDEKADFHFRLFLSSRCATNSNKQWMFMKWLSCVHQRR